MKVCTTKDSIGDSATRALELLNQDRFEEAFEETRETLRLAVKEGDWVSEWAAILTLGNIDGLRIRAEMKNRGSS